MIDAVLDEDFLLKRSKRRFNPIPTDQEREWLNRTFKLQNGVTGITGHDQTWVFSCMTWSERSCRSLRKRYLVRTRADTDEATKERS